MITAIVLIKADVSRIPQVAEAVADIEGVSEVYSVTGRTDLIAMVRVKEHEQLSNVVAEKLRSVDGITDTETHIAYRAYSKVDLEATFDLGLD
ncbi:Lrp/AsnC family transcriptional regulator [Nocardioides cavernaquae]|uniref:Lrp/AsnC family transcriptional regulator n=1 Tax=Nocardioides cavernaquae TaxID=2321396 RepID=A0A3A5H606_9ACTN|nr:Lrp/AsnC ligand binding domain-containing protein [Nocardioides cavernaquae]RJS44855.1 Lrp/AsnC family transcriptional regulator [Nocardioides cavernaquae]